MAFNSGKLSINYQSVLSDCKVACVANVLFPFSSEEIEQGNETGLSKQWGEGGEKGKERNLAPGPPSFSSRSFVNERLNERLLRGLTRFRLQERWLSRTNAKIAVLKTVKERNKYRKSRKAPGATADLTKTRQTSARTFVFLFLEFK